jgi:hypothetical protein
MKRVLIGAAAALFPATAFAADFSGDWTINFSVNNNPATVNCTIAQSGNTLSGHCLPKMPNAQPSDLKGMVDGSTAKWSYDVVFNGNPGHVGYEAKMTSPTAMSGTLSLAGTPTEFTGTKQ